MNGYRMESRMMLMKQALSDILLPTHLMHRPEML